VHILAISGSLREGSSNTRLLEAAALLAPPGVVVELYGGMGDLPHFNPDLEADESRHPRSVRELRAAVVAADGLLFCVPEYAHGIPGSLKNLLDWLVGGMEFYGKPVALLGASPHAVHGPASLLEVISTMGAKVIEEASITVNLRGTMREAGELARDPGLSRSLTKAVSLLAAAIAR
jgi:chromate reductase